MPARRTVTSVRAEMKTAAAAPIFGFALGWGAKYLHRTFGVAQAEVGHYLWLPPLAFDAGAILIGDLASRQRRPHGAPPRLLFASSIGPAASLALLPLAETPWHAVALLGTAMAGGGALYTLITSDLLARMPAGSVSFASGIMAGAQSLALIVLNPLIGLAVDHTQSYAGVTVAVGLWAIPGSLIWLAWRPAPRLIVGGR